MKWHHYLILLTISSGIYGAGQLEEVAEVPTSPLAKLLGPEKASQFGLHKLTTQEQTRWLSLLRAVSTSSVEKSAVAHLKNDGWEEVTYEGDVSKKGTTYSIFRFGILSDAYAVEKPFLMTILPGQYLAKPGILGDSLDSLLLSDGREHRFLLDTWIKVGR